MAIDIDTDTAAEFSKLTCTQNTLMLLRTLNATDGFTQMHELLRPDTLADIISQAAQLTKQEAATDKSKAMADLSELILEEMKPILASIQRRADWINKGELLPFFDPERKN